MKLHGFEEELLLGLQAAPNRLANGPDLAAFGLNGILSIVGSLDETIALVGQSQGSFQHFLRTNVESKMLNGKVVQTSADLQQQCVWSILTHTLAS